MMVRKTEEKDLDKVMEIIQQAKDYLYAQGIDQWQDGYPNRESIQEDIKNGISYVLEEEEIVGTCAISFEKDPYYDVIEEGNWLNEEVYGVVHRIAIQKDKKGHAYAKEFLDYATKQAQENQIHNLRVDTHKDNLSMQQFLKKNGFLYCGIIYVRDHAPRIAFQKCF